MAWEMLIAKSVPCTREQVRRVLATINPDDYLSRAVKAVKRREYVVPFINSLWHIDGNHKLIRWKIVIHGGIDGKIHLVTFTGANDNNRANTVTELFVQGTEKCGCPMRVRADHGGENLGVKAEMKAHRGRTHIQ